MKNPFSLKDKTILITGASSGIGRATAIACSQMGAKLFITGRDETRLNETLNALDGEGHEMHCADLKDKDDIHALIDRLPHLDGFVNNAGVVDTLPVDFVTPEKLEQIFSINTYAPITLCTTILQRRKLNRGASVVFTSSLSGNFIFSPGNSMYSASKAAMAAFARNTALEMAARHIRVNTVCPGMVETNIYKNGTITPEMLAEDAKRYPMKRYGKPEEVAYGIIYLLSDASSFVTGTQLVIDGGFTLL